MSGAARALGVSSLAVVAVDAQELDVVRIQASAAIFQFLDMIANDPAVSGTTAYTLSSAFLDEMANECPPLRRLIERIGLFWWVVQPRGRRGEARRYLFQLNHDAGDLEAQASIARTSTRCLLAVRLVVWFSGSAAALSGLPVGRPINNEIAVRPVFAYTQIFWIESRLISTGRCVPNISKRISMRSSLFCLLTIASKNCHGPSRTSIMSPGLKFS